MSPFVLAVAPAVNGMLAANVGFQMLRGDRNAAELWGKLLDQLPPFVWFTIAAQLLDTGRSVPVDSGILQKR